MTYEQMLDAIQSAIESWGLYALGNIREVLSSNKDTIRDIEIGKGAWHGKPFWAWGDYYVYFMKRQSTWDDEPNYELDWIPLRSAPKCEPELIGYFQ